LISGYPQTSGIVQGDEVENTATVAGNPYYTADINYILFGRLDRLLFDDKIIGAKSTSSMVKTILGYRAVMTPVVSGLKTLAFGPIFGPPIGLYSSNSGDGDAEGRAAWALVGFSMSADWSLASDSIIKNVLPNQRVFGGQLDWQAGLGTTFNPFMLWTIPIIAFSS
jgi:hypothetical protein